MASPPSDPTLAAGKLPTVGELDALVAQQQHALSQLIDARQGCEQALGQAQEQVSQLRLKIKTMQDDLAQRSLHIMTLIDSTDKLLLLRERIAQRAFEELQAVKARTGEPLDLTDDPHALRRATARVPLAVQIGMEGGSNLFLGASENISSGGVFVATYKPRPMGDRFSIQFALPGDASIISAVVEVAWLRTSDARNASQVPGMGLRFLAIDTADQAKLASFIVRRAPMRSPAG